ncbi:predicted protein [Micromonas commoda]|uniref:Calpain catalytic domain-containing protein n=1 Tax=Micromonas commoda (strain RCC299 / NOUM17 / CCMP2709) TaxID=296587 RepID=C1E045_MICCC|nr:predicted protein [Micromonas commoda]ACO60753.1 predicted protein [Micromonas commoda]|eukprot:XP_002499495.1 predicted protein [Micromonas commoda]
MGPCLSVQKNRNVAYHSARSMKNAANNPPKDIERNLVQLFEKADKSKFRFDEVISGGSYSYQKSGEKTEVEGLISDGIAEFKANPGKYVAISYQTSMADWPEDQQKYTLYMRKGWQGLKPKEADDGWQTWIVSSYECLPKIDLGSAADTHTDGMNYEGRKLHDPVNNPPLQPGRGMGCADIPGLKIIGDVDPNDVHQGQVGNCWLLSAISALAEFDGAVHKLFANTPGGIEDMPREGPNEYHVTLYDLSTWEPVDVVVDERLAANAQNPGKLLGAAPSDDGELWVCYLEKAFAVHCGGWDEINGGQCTHAWSILTGCKETYEIRAAGDGTYQCLGKYNPNEDKWEAQANSIKKSFPGLWPMKWPDVGVEYGVVDGEKFHNVSADDLFKKIAAWDANNYIIGAGTGGSGDDTRDTDGIVDGHAYTVLRAHEDVAGSGFDMVQVRNPHGHGELENGYWDDDGPGWDEHPGVKKALRPVQRDDGIFWMSKEEFFKYFGSIYLCAKDMSEFLRD